MKFSFIYPLLNFYVIIFDSVLMRRTGKSAKKLESSSLSEIKLVTLKELFGFKRYQDGRS